MLLRSVSRRVLGAGAHALRLRAKSGVREDVGEAHGAHAKSAAARRQEQEEKCARHWGHKGVSS